APTLIAISITLFAFATVICWAHYGEEAVLYLSEKKLPTIIYRLFYVICIPLGAILNTGLIWDISDILLSVMTVINCIAIAIHSNEIVEESKKYFKKNQARTRELS
ncbi:MAG: alanine:cation symporter family protein, partial [Clostridia bacterium]|nr:alanine:cation symporter family protein [Clostridia bacterium]